MSCSYVKWERNNTQIQNAGPSTEREDVTWVLKDNIKMDVLRNKVGSV